MATTLLEPRASAGAHRDLREWLERVRAIGQLQEVRGAGVAARWKDVGVSAQDLAEHLHDASYGIKHRVATPAEYRERMRVAVRLICRR